MQQQSEDVSKLKQWLIEVLHCLHQTVIHYRQHCAKRKAPVFNLLRGRF